MTIEIALKHAAIIGLFYAFYRLFLATTTFHGAKRAVLLGSLLLSAIPFFWMEQATAVASYTLPALGLGLPENPIPVSTLGPPSLSSIYTMGVYISACWLLIRLVLLFRLFQTSVPGNLPGIRWISEDKSPCSFLLWSFIPKGIEPPLEEKIVLHEKAHVKMGHSLDRLFLEVLQILFWFNPLLFLLRRELVKVHEYQADLHSQQQHRSYAESILEYARWKQETPLSSSINPYFDHLKNRINMLQQTPTNSLKRFLLVAVLPLCAAAVMITACSETEDVQTTTTTNTTPVVPTKTTVSLSPEESEKLLAEQDQRNTLQQMAGFPGGMEALGTYLEANLKYPEKEKADGIMETIYMNIKIEVDGTITDVKSVRGENQNFVEAAITALENMPRWEPALGPDGQPTASSMMLPVKFHLKGSE